MRLSGRDRYWQRRARWRIGGLCPETLAWLADRLSWGYRRVWYSREDTVRLDHELRRAG